MQQKLYHGAEFYPELCDEKTVEKDIELMYEGQDGKYSDT